MPTVCIFYIYRQRICRHISLILQPEGVHCVAERMRKDLDDVLKITSVEQYNGIYGFETRHPLVAVVDFSTASNYPSHIALNYGLYAIYLNADRGVALRYGMTDYRCSDGMVTGFSLGQVLRVDVARHWSSHSLGVVFHPDLICGTGLAAAMRQYSFMSYRCADGLPLDDGERDIFRSCAGNILYEIGRHGDGHSNRLIVRNIELLMDYCMRFYDRTPQHRRGGVADVLAKFEDDIDEYFCGGLAAGRGLPTLEWFAGRACLSPNYFSNLVKAVSGLTVREHVQDKIISQAKQELCGSQHSVAEVAFRLGFKYPHHFIRMFHAHEGMTPLQFRRAAQLG